MKSSSFNMQLSNNQQHAFEYITTNLTGTQPVLLQGSAGTGKTTLTKYLCDYYNGQQNTAVCAIAPTHKSKKVIKCILNQNTILPVSAMTVASALGKIKEHSYVGTKNYSHGNSKKLSMYSLFIIDEVSMIHDDDLRIILNFAKRYNKKLLIIGDSNQIPCPNSPLELCTDGFLRRKDSFVFNSPEILKESLTEIVRQAAESPIIKLACFMRDHLYDDLDFNRIMDETHFDSVCSYGECHDIFTQHFTIDNPMSARIICYTNSSVKTHNLEIRCQLRYDDEFVVGELLTGYANLGWPELIIENGEDYSISRIIHTNTYSIDKYRNLCGKLIDLNIAGTKTIVPRLFFIHVNHPNNNAVISKIIELAEKVNRRDSTKLDYQTYCQLKESVIFTEDIYKYGDCIFTEQTFKESHPLLFMRVNELVRTNSSGEFEYINSAVSSKINTQYNSIIVERVNDRYKLINDSETLADKYKVIEKDIYYGYAITAHKSQGSTYGCAIVDECDFGKITNKWNYKHNKMESRIKEKNQLRYVAYTRAKNNLFVVFSGSDAVIDNDSRLSRDDL